MFSPSYIWAKTLSRLEQQLTEVAVSAWLDDAEVIELTDDRLVVSSPSELRRKTIRDRFGPHIQTILQEILGRSVKFEVWGEEQLQQHRQKAGVDSSLFINPNFTFDNFIAGSSNRAAVNSARLAAAEPGVEYNNPLFLYGPPGVGKTHLLYAIINEVTHRSPEKRIVYVRSDQFTSELIKAIRDRTTDKFKAKYRHSDILLMDDIQFIAGKESTQEEFVHTFNELYEHQKQIVMTADRPPEAMATLEDRLKSRFGYGVLIGIDPPDPQTRLAITRSKAQRYRLSLDEDAIHYIADSLSTSVRQIEGALKTIRAFHELSGHNLTLEQIRGTVEDILAQEIRQSISADMVISSVCRYYHVEESQLKSSHRGKGITEPRQIAMYLIRDLVKLSFPEIAKLFSRDHSTVQHSVRKIEDALLIQDAHITQVIEDIITNIS